MNPSLERIDAEDTASVLALIRAVGWRVTPDQLRVFMANGSLFGHRSDGRLISCSALFSYGPTYAFIGLVIVHPDFQRQGLGRALVQRCLAERSPAAAPTGLIATDAGFPLYTSIGFQVVDQIHRYEYAAAEHSPLSDPHLTHRLTPIGALDIDDLSALDQTAFGVSRRGVYVHLVPDLMVGVAVRDESMRLQGYGLSIRNADLLVVGPLVASHVDIATSLLRRFVHEASGPVRINVPGHQTSFSQALLDMGFQPVSTSRLMVVGSDSPPGQRDLVYGILDPALG